METFYIYEGYDTEKVHGVFRVTFPFSSLTSCSTAGVSGNLMPCTLFLREKYAYDKAWGP